jgi:hypothetical protein
MASDTKTVQDKSPADDADAAGNAQDGGRGGDKALAKPGYAGPVDPGRQG